MDNLKIVQLHQEISKYRKQLNYAEKSLNHFMKATDDASLVIISLQSDLIKLLKQKIKELENKKTPD